MQENLRNFISVCITYLELVSAATQLSFLFGLVFCQSRTQGHRLTIYLCSICAYISVQYLCIYLFNVFAVLHSSLDPLDPEMIWKNNTLSFLNSWLSYQGNRYIQLFITSASSYIPNYSHGRRGANAYEILQKNEDSLFLDMAISEFCQLFSTKVIEVL